MNIQNKPWEIHIKKGLFVQTIKGKRNKNIYGKLLVLGTQIHLTK